jgi:hypothetical protein
MFTRVHVFVSPISCLEPCPCQPQRPSSSLLFLNWSCQLGQTFLLGSALQVLMPDLLHVWRPQARWPSKAATLHVMMRSFTPTIHDFCLQLFILLTSVWSAPAYPAFGPVSCPFSEQVDPEFLRRFFSASIQLIFALLHIFFLIFHHV